MKGFITGSRAYGKPIETSDVDLVVMVDTETLEKLRVLSDPSADGSIRFGNLNLVAFDNVENFILWQNCTNRLKEFKNKHNTPVSKAAAKKFMQEAGASGYTKDKPAEW
jgi:Nucleotidyltransferase domain